MAATAKFGILVLLILQFANFARAGDVYDADAIANANSGTTPQVVVPYNYGGELMLEDISMYYIYYGNFTPYQKLILEHFGNNVGSSAWYSTMHNFYYQQSSSSPKYYVHGNVKVNGTVTDNYSKGKNFTNAIGDVTTVITTHLNRKEFPVDENAIYLVITDSSVVAQGMCTEYCAWHSWMYYSGKVLKIHLIGGSTCPRSCFMGGIYNPSYAPNNDTLADGMTSLIAHELIETVSDMYIDAWVASGNTENGDTCAWKFSPTYTSGGKIYNQEMGGRKYLIQSTYDPVTQLCIQPNFTAYDEIVSQQLASTSSILARRTTTTTAVAISTSASSTISTGSASTVSTSSQSLTERGSTATSQPSTSTSRTTREPIAITSFIMNGQQQEASTNYSSQRIVTASVIVVVAVAVICGVWINKRTVFGRLMEYQRRKRLISGNDAMNSQNAV